MSERDSKTGERELIFGKYEILELLGRGGMAEVFKALSVGAAGFSRPVVIKRILPHLSANRQFVDMFIKEASIAAALDHPNIVQVFDLGETDGDLFMVLEFVPGVNLGTVVQHFTERGKVVPHQLVAYVAVDMCKALECAHGHHDERGIAAPVIHRDVSPQNVLLSMSGAVKLADFGLAMALSDARMTLPGVIKGKLGYMSPEQAGGARDLDTRSDLFSLGVVLYESIAGRRVFIGKSPADTIRRVRDVRVPPLEELAPQVSPPLLELVAALLEKDRENRPASAREVRKHLASYLRTVHPPVDANTLAGIVRNVVRERLEESGAGEGTPTDDVKTQAYQEMSDYDIDEDARETVSAPDFDGIAVDIEDEMGTAPSSTTGLPPTHASVPPEMQKPEGEPSVIMSRVVTIGGPTEKK